MIGQIRERVRKHALTRLNDRICRRAGRELPLGALPSFIVVTPHLTHLAPLATRNHTARIQPVLVANGIDQGDIAWLRRLCPDVPLIELRSSLRGNARSLLEHGIVINHLTRTGRDVFCIQDADCFVTDAAFWDSVTLDPTVESAAGPFQREGINGGRELPQTFLLCLNAALMREYHRTYGITAECSTRPPARARRLLSEAGYGDDGFLDTLKDYYDTLHQYWVAARHHGYHFRRLPGEGEVVHHIGGTSYLHRSFDDLAHWDYWPLNVHYLHLRLLELPACARFRDRFRGLVEYHGTARELLGAFPEYASGWRRRETDRVLELLEAESCLA